MLVRVKMRMLIVVEAVATCPFYTFFFSCLSVRLPPLFHPSWLSVVSFLLGNVHTVDAGHLRHVEWRSVCRSVSQSVSQPDIKCPIQFIIIIITTTTTCTHHMMFLTAGGILRVRLLPVQSILRLRLGGYGAILGRWLCF